MVKKAMTAVIKGALFVVTFAAYWFCLDEKYYRYIDAKIIADVDAAKAAHAGGQDA